MESTAEIFPPFLGSCLMPPPPFRWFAFKFLIEIVATLTRTEVE